MRSLRSVRFLLQRAVRGISSRRDDTVQGDNTVQIFCSYADSDEGWLCEMIKHLSLSTRQGLLTLWHHQHIAPGSNWQQILDTHLETADVILLLVSSDFLASDYCYGVEMKRALERHQKGEAQVIPILIRPVDWKHAPFAHLSTLPINTKPLSLWEDKDAALAEVCETLRHLLEEKPSIQFGEHKTSEVEKDHAGRSPAVWQAHHDMAAHGPAAASRSSQPEQTSLTILEPLTQEPECAWVIVWPGGEQIADIELTYDDQPDASRYASTLQDDLLQAIDDWGKEKPERYHELQEQAECVAVRMIRAKRQQYPGKSTMPQLKFCIWLEPSRYLYYVGVHTQLGKPAFHELRQRYFHNALIDLEGGQPLQLPSNFALHVVVVSKDRHLLLRQRNRWVSNYPLAWEAGVGEFMHGPGPLNGPVPEVRTDPGRAVFPHFSAERSPDLSLFLKNAIAEELGYHEAQPADFCLYGFAVEYQTLAPKLLAVYHSDLTLDELLQSASGIGVKDPARRLSSIALTPSAIAAAFSNGKYPCWEPKAKLLVLLALKQDLEATGNYEQSLEIARLTDRFRIDDTPDDPWRYA